MKILAYKHHDILFVFFSRSLKRQCPDTEVLFIEISP